ALTDALVLFHEAYEQAVSTGDSRARALAMLGRARATFGLGRLVEAARDAGAARDLLAEFDPDEARHAADLLAQLDHPRWVQQQERARKCTTGPHARRRCPESAQLAVGSAPGLGDRDAARGERAGLPDGHAQASGDGVQRLVGADGEAVLAQQCGDLG